MKLCRTLSNSQFITGTFNRETTALIILANALFLPRTQQQVRRRNPPTFRRRRRLRGASNRARTSWRLKIMGASVRGVETECVRWQPSFGACGCKESAARRPLGRRSTARPSSLWSETVGRANVLGTQLIGGGLPKCLANSLTAYRYSRIVVGE